MNNILSDEHSIHERARERGVRIMHARVREFLEDLFTQVANGGLAAENNKEKRNAPG